MMISVGQSEIKSIPDYYRNASYVYMEQYFFNLTESIPIRDYNLLVYMDGDPIRCVYMHEAFNQNTTF